METLQMTTQTQINFLERGRSLDISRISADSEFNTRKKVPNIEELSDSILSLGQTTPCGVVANGESFDLVYGFRRYNAIKALNDAGHNLEILVDVVDGKDANQLILLNVQENVSREQLTISEEYEAVARLSKFMSRDEIIEVLGVTKTWITQRMKLGDLSNVLRESVDEGLSVRAAQAVQLLPEELHEEFASRAAGQSVATVSDLVQARLDQIAGIDPEPLDDDGDIELLDEDDDLQPLDEDLEEDNDDEDDQGENTLKTYIKGLLNSVDDEDEERKEDKELLFQSINWNMKDKSSIEDLLRYILDDDDESEE